MKKIVKRDIFDKIYAHLTEGEITVITGARQTGKTTLLMELKEKLIAEKRASQNSIKIYNLDLIRNLEDLKDQTEFIKYLKEELKREKFLYVFIDEVQRIENPGIFLKGIYDLNLPIKFVVTGSSSLEIRSKISETLTGRKRVFYVWPFSFSEYIRAKEPRLLDLIKKSGISKINRSKMLEHFYEYITFGGYPRVVLAKETDEKIQILNEIYTSYIEKDVVGYLKIKKPLFYSKLIVLLANQVGSLMNFDEICNALRINFRTLESYVSALENTFVIKLVRPYFTNAKKEIIKMPKVYFIDTGLRNFAMRNFAPFTESRDKGKLLESSVFASLLRREDLKINYWRTKDKNEVDFVLRDFYGNIVPLEVKASEIDLPKFFRNLKIFLEKYNLKTAYVVNLSLEETTSFEGKSIKFILPYSVGNVKF